MMKKKKTKKKRSVKSKVIGILTILLFVVGFAILAYPTVSSKWNAYRESLLISKYEADMVASGEDYTPFFEAAEDYNSRLVGGVVPDVFAVRDNVPDPEYEALLSKDGSPIMGYISIPSIEVKLSIYHYSTEQSLQAGAGHLAGSSLPVGGSSTHAVITAHRGLPNAKMFTDLNLLRIGDKFWITVFDRTIYYEVDQINEVYPYETEDLVITDSEDYCTLITCTPYAVNTMRLLVRGHRVEYTEEEIQEVIDNEKDKAKDLFIRSFDWIQVVCIALGAIVPTGVALIIRATKKKRKKKKKKKHEQKKQTEEQPDLRS